MDLSFLTPVLDRLKLPHDPWLETGLLAIILAALALLIYRLVFWITRRLVRSDGTADKVLRRISPPLQSVLVFLALDAAWSAAPDNLLGLTLADRITTLGLIMSGTWMLVALLHLASDRLESHYAATTSEDPFYSRRVRTQSRMLTRVLASIVIILGAAAALMTFPSVRHLGTSLLASAGLAGIVAGFAARPVLGSLIAGVQIAITQPLRLGDVLIVEQEWGTVEEITGTYVVFKTWDERRLIIPLEYFTDHVFQNWTRSSTTLLGSVFLWVDYGTPLDGLRNELERLCKAAPEWDKRTCVLQVTDTNEKAMQLRALVSAPDASRAWDLRCKVREGLIRWLRANTPDNLPRLRTGLDGMLDTPRTGPGKRERISRGNDDGATPHAH